MTLYWGTERADTIKVKIIPIGAFFNGDFKYSPKAKNEIDTGHTTRITGAEIFIPPQSDSNVASRKFGNFDIGPGISDFAFGYGKYKLEFYRQIEEDSPYTFVNYTYIDYRDAGNTNSYNQRFDVRIDYFSKDTITFQHAPHDSNYVNYNRYFWHIDLVNKNIVMDNLFGTCLAPLTPVLGTFSVDTSYITYPINANKYNGNLGQENPGDLGMNLEINDSVTTRDTLSGSTMDILIPKKGYLKINPGKTFNMIHAVNGYNNLIVQDSSELRVLGELIVGPGNVLTLKNKGKIIIGNKVTFKPGSYFCNEGGKIEGRGVLVRRKMEFSKYDLGRYSYSFSS